MFIQEGGGIPPERVFGPWKVTESSKGAEFFTKWAMSIAKLCHGEKISKKISGGYVTVAQSSQHGAVNSTKAKMPKI